MKRIILTIAAIATLALAAFPQTTEFTYQGNLTSGSTPANTPHDFEFRLFSADTGGSAIGTLQRLNVQVVNGSFAVKLDFGAQFPGANRFLEISVRPAGGGSFQLLTPRQPVSNTPYAVRSLNAANADTAASATNATNAVNATNATNATTATNATNATTATNALQLGGVAANQYVLTTDPRMSDARNPLPNSGSYVQNGTSAQTANFNVSGNGTAGGTLSANVVNSATQYNIEGIRILSAPTGTANLYAGIAAGNNVGTGNQNSAFGYFAGELTNSGGDNSYFGYFSGRSTVGSRNSFFGSTAGRNTVGGNDNTFIGGSAGLANTVGSNNTMLGSGTNVLSNNLSFATAIGANATVGASNTIALGRTSGADTVQIPGPLSVTGALTANGSGLTNLNAGNFSSGTLGVARGGTGLSTLGATGTFLRSDGAGWTSSALLAADITAGSGNYIQNTTTQQATSNFNISGNGLIAGRLGIGTSNPVNKVDAVTAVNTYGFVHSDGTRTLGTFVNSIENSGMIGTNSAHPFQIFTSNAGPVATFTAGGTISGRVGIGTSAPGARLSVVGNAAGSGDNTANFSNTAFVGGHTSHVHFGTTGDWFVRSAASAGKVVLQDTGGNVGIGPGVPTFKLHVVQPASNGLRVQTNTAGGSVASFGGTGEFSVDAPGVPAGRLWIAENGNVGIGGAIFSDTKLTVSGTGIVRTRVNSDSNAGFGLSLGSLAKWSIATVSPGQFQIYNDAIGSNALWIDGTSNNVAIGTTNTAGKLRVDGGLENGLVVTTNNVGAYVAQFGGTGVFAVDSATSGGGRFRVLANGATEINIPGTAGEINTRLNVNGSIKLNMIPNPGASVCWSGGGLNTLVACGVSSIRHKDNVNDFSAGLDLIRRLRPVSYNWKNNGMPDMGLIAEEVARAEPLLATYEADGTVQGVKYDRVGLVAVNAIKEQQTQIEDQARRIAEQKTINEKLQRQIDLLTKIICRSNPSDEVCKEEK